jgi:signal transduction histidine kinase
MHKRTREDRGGAVAPHDDLSNQDNTGGRVNPDATKVTSSRRREHAAEFCSFFIIGMAIILVYFYYQVGLDVHYYLLFHVLIELFSIVILGSIFIIGWNTRNITQNGFFLVIGISSFFVAIMDTLHLLAFPGMGFFMDIATPINLSPQLWISARYFQSITILTSLLAIKRKMSPVHVLSSLALTASLLIVLVFAGIFPDAHDGTGLTPFKIASEYVIISFLGLACLFTLKNKSFFTKSTYRYILAFLIALIASESMFTIYSSAYEVSNMLGHVFKIVAFAFAYKAIVRTSLEKPLESLFKKLVDTDEDLQKRNVALAASNENLQREIAERRRAESTLHQFISTISHEFRTPVTVLDQSVQNLIKFNERLSTDQENMLISAISKNMVIMTDLVENVMNLTRIDEHELLLTRSRFNIKDIIISMLKEMNKTLSEKQSNVNVEITDAIMYFGDVEKIRQVAQIFLENAVKFSKPGKPEIVIKARDHYTGDFNPESVDGVLLQFIDNGIGIDEDLFPRLFDRFARSHRVKDIPGSGLGLAIAKEFVTLHGGKIYTSSSVDNGTTFSVFLPHDLP